jgi:hypothetical protein
LLTLLLMALLRIKRPEQLKERDPAAFGRLLGLDRAPEVKTDAALTKALPRLLGEVRDLVGERRVTIVFDRGGWSPRLFAAMIKGRLRPADLSQGPLPPHQCAAVHSASRRARPVSRHTSSPIWPATQSVSATCRGARCSERRAGTAAGGPEGTGRGGRVLRVAGNEKRASGVPWRHLV